MRGKGGKWMKKRLVWIDSLRLVSIWGTILIHDCAEAWRESESLRWQYTFWQTLIHFCVPVFFMLSGTMMLQNVKTSTSVAAYVKKRIAYVVKIYVFWNSVYTVLIFLNNGRYNFRAALKTALEGRYHLWFLWALVGLYLITPLLDFAYDKRKCQYFLILFAAFGIFLNYGVNILKIPTLIQINQQLLLTFATQYVGYYVLGYYLHCWPPSPKQRRFLQCLGIITFFTCGMVTLWASARAGQTQTEHVNYLTPYMLFISIAVYVTAQQMAPFWEKQKWVSTAASYVFGVYVLHDAVFRAIGVAHLKEFYNMIPPLVSVPLATTVIFLLCFLICLLLKRIPVIKTFL